MDNQNRFSIPPMLIVLDFAGMLLLGLGIAKLQTNLDVLPEFLRFTHSGWLLVVAGIALMVPLVLHVMKFALNQAK